jgi:hypothetical protein
MQIDTGPRQQPRGFEVSALSQDNVPDEGVLSPEKGGTRYLPLKILF